LKVTVLVAGSNETHWSPGGDFDAPAAGWFAGGAELGAAAVAAVSRLSRTPCGRPFRVTVIGDADDWDDLVDSAGATAGDSAAAELGFSPGFAAEISGTLLVSGGGEGVESTAAV
jgi:hypothetical protein